MSFNHNRKCADILIFFKVFTKKSGNLRDLCYNIRVCRYSCAYSPMPGSFNMYPSPRTDDNTPLPNTETSFRLR